MTSTTSPDNLVKWTTSDPASFLAANNQLADSTQAALLLRAQKSYEWSNKTERDAQTGMQAGYTGYQADINMFWYYDGTRWVPMTGITPFTSTSVRDTQIPTPWSGASVKLSNGWEYQYRDSSWKPVNGMYRMIPTAVSGTGVTVGS